MTDVKEAGTRDAGLLPNVDAAGSTSNSTKRPRAQRKRSGGCAPRQKGNRAERHLICLLQDAGHAAERRPLSGAAGGSYIGDATVPLLGRDLVIEVKCRAAGFTRLYEWLERRDLLVLKNDRKEFLVVLPLRMALEVARAAERGKESK